MTEHIIAEHPTMEQVVHLFENWRSTRQKRQPIPELLWQSAVNLSPVYPTYKIARTLRLDYSKLKKRIEDANTRRDNIQDVPPAFVELELGTSIAANCECTLELKSSNGAQLKMHWKGDRGFDTLEMCNAFWSQCV